MQVLFLTYNYVFLPLKLHVLSQRKCIPKDYHATHTIPNDQTMKIIFGIYVWGLSLSDHVCVGGGWSSVRQYRGTEALRRGA